MTTEKKSEPIKKPNLFQLGGDRLAILEKIAMQYGEITPEDDQALFGNTQAIEDKAEAYLACLDRLTKELELAREQERLAKNYGDGIEATMENMKKRLATCLIGCEMRSVKAGMRTITICDPKASLQILCLDAIPNEYLRLKPPVEEVDKARLKSDLEAGKAIDGATLKFGDPTIAIRSPRKKEKSESAQDGDTQTEGKEAA